MQASEILCARTVARGVSLATAHTKLDRSSSPRCMQRPLLWAVHCLTHLEQKRKMRVQTCVRLISAWHALCKHTLTLPAQRRDAAFCRRPIKRAQIKSSALEIGPARSFSSCLLRGSFKCKAFRDCDPVSGVKVRWPHKQKPQPASQFIEAHGEGRSAQRRRAIAASRPCGLAHWSLFRAIPSI